MPCSVENAVSYSHLQNVSVPKSVTSSSHCSLSVGRQDDLPPTVSNCVINGPVLNPVAVMTSGLSVSANGISPAANSLALGASLLRAVSRPYVSCVSSASVSSLRDTAKCCRVITTPISQFSLISRSVTARSDPKPLNQQCSMVSVDMCPSLRACGSARPRSSSRPLMSSTLLALISKAASLKSQLVAASADCDNVVSSDHLVQSSSSVMREPRVSSASSVSMMTSCIVSSPAHTFTSASASCSSLSTLCSSIMTGSRHQSTLAHPFQHPDKRLQSDSVSPSSPAVVSVHSVAPSSPAVVSVHNVAPLSVMVRLPRLSLSSAAVRRHNPTGISSEDHTRSVSVAKISNEVCLCTRSTARISNQLCTCTVPSLGISNQGRIHAVPTPSVVSDGVAVYDVPAAGISKHVCLCTVPTVEVSNLVGSRTATTAGIFSPVHVCTISPAGFPDRAQMGTTTGISNHVHVSAVPSVGISSPVCSCDVLGTAMKRKMEGSENVMWNGDMTPESSVSCDMQRCAPVSRMQRVLRTRRVLPLASRCSTSQTSLSSASLPSPVSLCSPASSTFQIEVKSSALLASTVSPTYTESVSGLSATSRSDRHFLDSFRSLKTKPVVLSSVMQPGHTPASSMCRSAATGNYVARMSSSRNSVTGSCQTSSCMSNTSAKSADASSVGSVRSCVGPTSDFRGVPRPTFLFSPQNRPLLDKIAFHLSSQDSSSKFATQTLRKRISNIDNSTVSAVDGAAESVVKVASSPADFHCHGNRENRCHANRDVSIQAVHVSVVKAPESVAMVTASLADCHHLSNRGIYCHRNGELSSLTTNVADNKAIESVVMGTTSCSCHGSIENHHHGNRDICSLTANTASHKASAAVKSVVMDTADYCHHSNREMLSLADTTASSVIKESVALVTTSPLGSHHRSNREMFGHYRGDREMFDVAETTLTACVQRRTNKVKLCSEVNVIILHVIMHCLQLSYSSDILGGPKSDVIVSVMQL